MSLAKLFTRIDADGSGHVTLDELMEGARKDAVFQSRPPHCFEKCFCFFFDVLVLCFPTCQVRVVRLYASRAVSSSSRLQWASPDLDHIYIYMSDRMSEVMPDRKSDRRLKTMSGRMSKFMSYRMTEFMPDKMSEFMSDRLSEFMSNRISESMPDRMSDFMLDRRLGFMSDRMSGFMSDRR